MLVLLSPAKSMCSYRATQFVATCPVLLDQTDVLLRVMKGKTKGDLKVSGCSIYSPHYWTPLPAAASPSSLFFNPHNREWWPSAMISLVWTTTDIRASLQTKMEQQKKQLLSVTPFILLLQILKSHLSFSMDQLIGDSMLVLLILNSIITLNRCNLNALLCALPSSSPTLPLSLTLILQLFCFVLSFPVLA